MTPSPLPAASDPVTLRLPDADLCFTVQVHGIDGTHLVVTAPTVNDELRGGLREALFELEWSSVRGLLTAPVRWVGHHNEQVWRWELEICGPVSTSQRRRYVRAPLLLPAQLHVGAALRDGRPDLDTATALDATLLDLSEAGVRLMTPLGARYADALVAGRAVVVEMDLLGDRLLLPGSILNALPVVPPGGQSRCVVVVLDDPGPAGAVLRRAVLQAQIEARKAWV